MKNLYKILVMVFVFIGGVQQFLAQTTGQESDNNRQMRQQRAREDQQAREIGNRALRMRLEVQNSVLQRNKNNVSVRYKPSLTKSDLKAIAILPEDLKTHYSFLKQKNTGIFRIHSADNCSPISLVIQASTTCPNNVEGKATSFSFRKEDYTNQIIADIFYAKGSFSSNGVNAIGIIGNLGVIDLNDVNENTEGVKSLIEFVPSLDETAVKYHKTLIRKGFQVGKYIYGNETKVSETDTFVLRNIAYRGSFFNGTGTGKVNILEDDERLDLTIAFKVIRKHEDESLSIIWKIINKQESPKMLSDKDKKTNKKVKNEFLGLYKYDDKEDH